MFLDDPPGYTSIASTFAQSITYSAPGAVYSCPRVDPIISPLCTRTSRGFIVLLWTVGLEAVVDTPLRDLMYRSARPPAISLGSCPWTSCHPLFRVAPSVVPDIWLQSLDRRHAYVQPIFLPTPPLDADECDWADVSSVRRLWSMAVSEGRHS